MGHPRPNGGTVRSMEFIKHWIDNEAVDGGDRSGDVYNPATGEKTARVVYASRGDVDRAVASAKKALASWGKTSIAKRSRVLFAYRELVERNKDTIARMLTLEHGKVLSDAAGEVQRGQE